MERLTFEGNFCEIALCLKTPGGSFCEDGTCSQRKVWERLKAYEDTGLTPEEALSMRMDMAIINAMLDLACDLWSKAFDKFLDQRDVLHQFREFQKDHDDFLAWKAVKETAAVEAKDGKNAPAWPPDHPLRYDGIVVETFKQLTCQDCPRLKWRNGDG